MSQVSGVVLVKSKGRRIKSRVAICPLADLCQSFEDRLIGGADGPWVAQTGGWKFDRQMAAMALI